jgi:hypothetical protein
MASSCSGPASGYLVIGAHEVLPETLPGFEALARCSQVLRWRGSGGGDGDRDHDLGLSG